MRSTQLGKEAEELLSGCRRGGGAGGSSDVAGRGEAVRGESIDMEGIPPLIDMKGN